jgi:hypothetical protein
MSDNPSGQPDDSLASIKDDLALRRLAASTIAGKRSAQSYPFLVEHHEPEAIMFDFVDPVRT